MEMSHYNAELLKFSCVMTCGADTIHIENTHSHKTICFNRNMNMYIQTR